MNRILAPELSILFLAEGPEPEAIGDSFKSLLEQKSSFLFEIVVIGSERQHQRLKNVLSELRNSGDRVFWELSAEPKNLAGDFEKALIRARANYLIPVSAGAYFHPEHLETLYALAKEYPKQVVMSGAVIQPYTLPRSVPEPVAGAVDFSGGLDSLLEIRNFNSVPRGSLCFSRATAEKLLPLSSAAFWLEAQIAVKALARGQSIPSTRRFTTSQKKLEPESDCSDLEFCQSLAIQEKLSILASYQNIPIQTTLGSFMESLSTERQSIYLQGYKKRNAEILAIQDKIGVYESSVAYRLDLFLDRFPKFKIFLGKFLRKVVPVAKGLRARIRERIRS